MAFETSAWVEADSQIPEQGGRSKRLCTGFSNANEPGSTFQIQQASSQISPGQLAYNASCYDSNVLNVQACSAWAVDFDHVSRQRVGNEQGQTLFQSHQNAPWSSLDHHSQYPSLEGGGTTSSAYHQVSNVQPALSPALHACDSRYLPSSAINFQRTATSNIPHGKSSPSAYHQPDVDTLHRHQCQDSTFAGTAGLQKSGNTGDEDASYELCLGLVCQIRL